MTVYAIVETLKGGYQQDIDKITELGLKIGDRFTVKDISMGQSNTRIYLNEIEGGLNSIHFSFEENEQPLNIFTDPRFNPYLCTYYIQVNPETTRVLKTPNQRLTLDTVEVFENGYSEIVYAASELYNSHSDDLLKSIDFYRDALANTVDEEYRDHCAKRLPIALRAYEYRLKHPRIKS